MSVLVILMGIILPSLNMVKKYARKVKQKSQFHGIEIALEFYNAEQESYPPSDNPPVTLDYCGAMKLAEAMVGKDFAGFNPESDFSPGDAYYNGINLPNRTRYLKLEGANVKKIGVIYGPGSFDPCEVVLCDVYSHIVPALGERSGMPILYYRANTSNTKHDFQDPGGSIYNYLDNHEFVKLDSWYQTSLVHPLFNDPDGEDNVAGGGDDEQEGEKLYIKTKNEKAPIINSNFNNNDKLRTTKASKRC